jgi:hypothetical protein
MLSSKKVETRFCGGDHAERNRHLSLAKHRDHRYHCDVNAAG